MRRGALLVAAAVALDAVACFALAGASGATNDLFPRWLATRLWLTAGQDLYSPATDTAIREAMGQPPLGGDTFVFGFVYPAYVALLLVPLAILPFRAAATLWLMLTQLAAVGGALLCWRADERERRLLPRSPLPALVVAALLPATVMNVIFLQFSALALLGLALAWWLLARGAQARAGAALLLALVKPQLTILPAIGLTVQALWLGWRRVVVAAGVGGAAIALLSMVAFPGWPERFLESTARYASVARPESVSSLLGGWLVGVCVAGAVAFVWWRSSRRVGDGLAATSLLSVWLVPPLYEWNSVLLLVAIVPALRGTRTRGARVCWMTVGALVAASALTLWAYTLWPSVSRAIWPSLALALYLVVFGSQSVTASAASPSVAERS